MQGHGRPRRHTTGYGPERRREMGIRRILRRRARWVGARLRHQGG